jgi:hypothetical protein
MLIQEYQGVQGVCEEAILGQRTETMLLIPISNDCKHCKGNRSRSPWRSVEHRHPAYGRPLAHSFCFEHVGAVKS